MSPLAPTLSSLPYLPSGLQGIPELILVLLPWSKEREELGEVERDGEREKDKERAMIEKGRVIVREGLEKEEDM